MYVELNKHISYIKKKTDKKSRVISSASDRASSAVLYKCMNIYTDEDVSRYNYKF